MVTATVLATPTAIQTATFTPAAVWNKLKIRQRGQYPDYASACSSWKRYVSACLCAGVVPVTLTVDAPSTTIMARASDALVASVFSPLTSTETADVPVTATTSATEIEVIPVTANHLGH